MQIKYKKMIHKMMQVQQIDLRLEMFLENETYRNKKNSIINFKAISNFQALSEGQYSFR